MNGYNVYKNIVKLKGESDYKAESLYLALLGNLNKSFDDILYLKTFTDEYNKEIYLQVKILFDLRKQVFKKLLNKGIIKSDSDQSGIDNYEKTVGEITKLRRQRLDEIKKTEQDINNKLFKQYFKYQNPSNMYKELDKTKNTEINQINIEFIKKTLSKLQEDIGNTSKNSVNKIRQMHKIADIVELIFNFNDYDDDDNQEGKGLKILTPS